jgi:multiple sugar transport system permease protein
MVADLIHEEVRMSVQAATPAAKMKLKSTTRLRNTLTFWAFVGPLALGLLIFVYVPILWGFIISFFEARQTVTPTQFVGLANYVDMLKDPNFIKALVTFMIFAVFIVPTTFFISLALALLVNNTTRGTSFFRTVFFLPTACSYVVASMTWRMSIFNGLPFGFANIVLDWFGIAPIQWIGKPEPPYFWIVLVTVRLWLQLGFYMILFLAGLQEIDRSLYEAAFVDGARRGWQTFRHITFPLLRNTSISILLLNLIAAFQAFDEFYNVLSTGVGSSSNITLARPPLVYIYQVAMADQNYGRGSAGAFILVAIIIAVTIIQGRLFGLGKTEA